MERASGPVRPVDGNGGTEGGTCQDARRRLTAGRLDQVEEPSSTRTTPQGQLRGPDPKYGVIDHEDERPAAGSGVRPASIG